VRFIPNGTSRGYYHGGYYAGGYGGVYYDRGYSGGGYGGSGVIVSSGDRNEHHHGDGYSNEYYDRENNHVNGGERQR
jgi:hypothetical protein